MKLNVKPNVKSDYLWDGWVDHIQPISKFPNIFCEIIFKYLNDIGRMETITDVIETGTYEGNSSICFSYLFDTVHTVEKYPDINPYNRKSLRTLHSDIKLKHPNINFYYGDSPAIMTEIFTNNPNKDYFILLDAHVGLKTPVMEEIQSIKTHSKSKNHVIMIDDCNDISVDFNKLLDINSDYNIVNTNLGNGIVLVY